MQTVQERQGGKLCMSWPAYLQTRGQRCHVCHLCRHSLFMSSHLRLCKQSHSFRSNTQLQDCSYKQQYGLHSAVVALLLLLLCPQCQLADLAGVPLQLAGSRWRA